MCLWTLVGVGLCRILFFQEFSSGAAELGAAVVWFRAHLWLTAREHR